MEREHGESSENTNWSKEKPPQHTNFQRFLMLSKFMFPLAITLMAPNITEQIVTRSITSIASSEMVLLLASFGLATTIVKIFTNVTYEFRYITIVLVETMADYRKMLILSVLISGIFCILVINIGLTLAGRWLIGDIFQQSKDVVDLTLFIMCALAPLSLMEGVANYHEGGLIKYKLTHYAATAKFADIGFQTGFVMVLLFTPTRSEPILIPISALYAGMIARLILDVGFWYVLVRREVKKNTQLKKPVTMVAGLKLWASLAFTRLVQLLSLPIVSLGVSRQLAKTSKELAAEALAVLTVVAPTAKSFYAWLNDLRMIMPTFYVATKQHAKFPMKVLLLYSFGCTLLGFVIIALLLMNPVPARFVMHTVIGVTPQLAEKCLEPMRIFAIASIGSGIRSVCASYLIYRKKTVYLTPGAFLKLGALLVALISLPYTGLSGPVYGVTALLIGLAAEDIFVIIGILLLKHVEPAYMRWKEGKATTIDEERKTLVHGQ